MRRILLIEDQLDFQLMVKSSLKGEYEISIASNAADGFRLADSTDVDLILLDVGLPDEDGLTLFTRIKTMSRSSAVPVIFLTGRSATEDVVAGFSLGADDYIIKPFDPVQFKARIDAKIRAIEKQKTPPIVIRKGPFELDCAMSRAFTKTEIGGKAEMDLTPHEFRLLVYFVQHENKNVTRDELMSAVWSNSTHVLLRTVDRHISSLRKKLDPKYAALDAVHSTGYRFTVGPF